MSVRFSEPIEPVPPRPTRRSWPPAARIAGGCGAGCLVLVLLQFVVMVFVTSLVTGAYTTAIYTANVQAPKTATAGRAFPLTLTVRNLGKEPFTIQNIIVRRETLDRFTIESPKPAPSAPSMTAFGVTTWTYQQKVPPGEKWQVQFQAVPQETGSLSGAAEVQIDALPKAQEFTVEVKPAPTTRPTQPRR